MADLRILEQVILARNRAAHVDSIVAQSVDHDEEMLRKHPQPFFMNENDQFILDIYPTIRQWLPINLKVDQEKLHTAINHAEFLVRWLEPYLQERC
jgi:hypothetical protein